MSAEAMYPFPPVTHAVFFLSPADDDIVAVVYAAGDWQKPDDLLTKLLWRGKSDKICMARTSLGRHLAVVDRKTKALPK